MKEKYITEAVPPSTTRSRPVTLDEVLGPTRWLPWHWCGSAAALHPQSLTLHWCHLFIMKLIQNWDMSPGRMTDSPLLGIFQKRLKKL